MEVSDQIIKVLDEIGKRFGMAIDWTQSNIAPYIQQLGQRIVNYELWTSIVWIVLMIILFIVSIILLKKSIKWVKDDDPSIILGIFGVMSSIVAIIISIIVTTTQVFDIVTCLTLPEKIWMDYIQQYLHK